MKNLCFVVLLIASAFALGCGSTSSARAPSGDIVRRGAVVVEGPAVRALVAGPAVVHAYSAFPGGAVFTAAAGADASRACAEVVARGAVSRGAALEADRRVSLAVGPGEVACLRTAGKGNMEVLWHAHVEERPAPTAIAVARAGW